METIINSTHLKTVCSQLKDYDFPAGKLTISIVG